MVILWSKLKKEMKFAEFEIKSGQHLAIVGDNGSGKSLLVESLRRKLPRETEYISFRDTYGDEADGAYYLQLRWNRQDLANHIELDGAAKDLFSLSSGELRKHRIARALQTEASFIIIDNPYLGLDVRSRSAFSETLSQIASEGARTIVLVMPGAAIMPQFISEVAYVKGVDDVEIKDTDEFMAEYGRRPLLKLPPDRQAALESIPCKDLSEVKFYPSCENAEIVKCNAVSIRYDSRTILDSLDWTVKEGECWAVTGENGSGKSTLLSLVCADNPQAYACDIELFGHKRGSGESIWDIKKHIGYVSPEMHRAYQKNIPALEVVASGFFDTVGMYMHANERQLEICRVWMKIFGIEDLADKPYLRISSGEQRLCLLARAFVKDPELLILDEPMHGLDPQNCEHVRQIVDLFVARPHKTLLFVTHFENELPTSINHTLHLKKNF